MSYHAAISLYNLPLSVKTAVEVLVPRTPILRLRCRSQQHARVLSLSIVIIVLMV